MTKSRTGRIAGAGTTGRQGGIAVDKALAGIAVEGACDFFFGRPLEANPYARQIDAWEAWRFGWSEASWFNRSRGAVERRRWKPAA